MKEKIKAKIDEYVQKILDKPEIDKDDFMTLQMCYNFYSMAEWKENSGMLGICGCL